MATENSTVQINIKVVDANSGQVIAQATQHVEKLGAAGARAGQQAAAGLNTAGSAGTQAGKSIAAGMDHANEHTLNSMDSVRLLRDDLGIRIPRAMEKVIANSTLMSSAIGAAGTALVGLGSAELIIQMGEQVYHVYENWLDAGKGAREYGKALDEIKAKDFTATRSIETSQARLQQGIGNVRSLADSASAAQARAMQDLRSFNLGGFIGNQIAASQLAGKQYQAQGQVDQVKDSQSDQQHEINVQQIETNHALDGELQGRAKINAEYRKTVDLHRENDRFKRDSEGRAGNVVGAGDELGDLQVLAAKRNAAAESANLTRKENDEVARMREEAHASGLQGEEKYQAQLMAKIEGFRRRVREDELSGGAAAAMTNIAKQQAAAEAAERLRAEQAEDRRRLASSAGAGNTGLARMDDQRAAALAAIDDKVNNHGYVDPSQAGRDRGYANQTSDVEAAKAQKDFTDRLAQMDDSRANSSMSANQRIDAETRRTVAEIQKSWDELYGHLASDDSRRLQGQIVINAEIAKINAAAAAQKAEATRGIADETRHMEDEAARYGLPKYQEQQRAIVDEYRERYEKLEQLRAKDKDNDDLYRRQEVAAEQIKNGKLLDERRQLRDKLAGELRGFMSNPLEALKKQGEGVASKAVADLILGTGRNAKGGVGGGPMDLFRGTFKRNGGVPGMGGDAPHAEHGTAAQGAVVNATTAVIHVGSASFAGAGPGAGAATVSGIAGSGYVPTGNGGFFNLGGSGAGGSAGGGSAEAGSPSAALAAATAQGSGGLGVESRDNSDISGMGVSDVLGNATSINNASKNLGLKGGLQSKIPGLKNMSDEDMGKLSGTASGVMGVYSAFEGKGGWGGAASGALSGAQAGMQYGGLAGAAVGAVVGGALGFIGHGARVQAQKYWFKELQPKLQAEMLGFEAGTADYQTVYDDLNSSDLEAKNRTKQMGSGAVDYYGERIKPAIQADMQRLTREQKAGRSQFGMTAAQFHDGGFIGGFGSMATGADTGWIHAQRGEVVLNQQAAMSHLDVAQMMNAGSSRADIASYMGGSGGERAAVQGGGDVNLHFTSHDPKGAYNLFMDNAHHVRAALNQSYGEDSGGSN